MNESRHTDKTKKEEEIGKTLESTESVKDPALKIKIDRQIRSLIKSETTNV